MRAFSFTAPVKHAADVKCQSVGIIEQHCFEQRTDSRQIVIQVQLANLRSNQIASSDTSTLQHDKEQNGNRVLH
jgi:hypothetical protein